MNFQFSHSSKTFTTFNVSFIAQFISCYQRIWCVFWEREEREWKSLNSNLTHCTLDDGSRTTRKKYKIQWIRGKNRDGKIPKLPFVFFVFLLLLWLSHSKCVSYHRRLSGMETVPYIHIYLFIVRPRHCRFKRSIPSQCNVYVAERGRSEEVKIEENWEKLREQKCGNWKKKEGKTLQHTTHNSKRKIGLRHTIERTNEISLLSHMLSRYWNFSWSFSNFFFFSSNRVLACLRLKIFSRERKKWKLMRKRDISSFKRRENEHWIVSNYHRLLKLHNYMWKVKWKKISRFLGESSRKASHTVLEFEER